MIQQRESFFLLGEDFQPDCQKWRIMKGRKMKGKFQNTSNRCHWFFWQVLFYFILLQMRQLYDLTFIFNFLLLTSIDNVTKAECRGERLSSQAEAKCSRVIHVIRLMLLDLLECKKESRDSVVTFSRTCTLNYISASLIFPDIFPHYVCAVRPSCTRTNLSEWPQQLKRWFRVSERKCMK